jgi:hypothetical protein
MTRSSDDQLRLTEKIKTVAAEFGADAVFPNGETARPTQQTMTTTIGNRWHQFALVETENVSTRFHLNATAIHLAQPGTEAYSGIMCSTYSPYSIEERAQLGDPLRLADVRGAYGPAAAAGVQNGDLVLEWWVNGKDGYGDCWALSQAIRNAGLEPKSC